MPSFTHNYCSDSKEGVTKNHKIVPQIKENNPEAVVILSNNAKYMIKDTDCQPKPTQ